jgi:hypothetical protein
MADAAFGVAIAEGQPNFTPPVRNNAYPFVGNLIHPGADQQADSLTMEPPSGCRRAAKRL